VSQRQTGDSHQPGHGPSLQRAIATVSASRASWYRVGAWDTSFKYGGDNASIGYYYGLELVKNGKSAGEALYTVKSDIGTNGSYWSGDAMMSAWMNLFDFNLYGDPATVLVSTHQPVNPYDFNSDGKPDIVWRNRSTGQNSVWLMNGTALVSGASLTPVADANWEIVGTADFNGDGKVDLLWRNRSTGRTPCG